MKLMKVIDHLGGLVVGVVGLIWAGLRAIIIPIFTTSKSSSGRKLNLIQKYKLVLQGIKRTSWKHST